MSYVDGETLENLLEDGGLREREVLEIAKTVAETLKYTWDKHRMLHRDIKPANIMLDKRGRVALMDLGIARIVDEGSGGRATIVHGTPQYMSPEQASGLQDLDSRADIYSLGATLYHLLCNRELFPCPDMDLILQKQIHEKPEAPRKLNPNISRPCEILLMGWLSKAREDRPDDWDDAIGQLNRVLDNRHPTRDTRTSQNSRKAKPTGKKSLRTSRAIPRLKGMSKKEPERPAAKKKPRPPRQARPVYPTGGGGGNSTGVIIGAFVAVLFLIIIIVAANK